jgi:hypothetical protein
MYLQGYLLSHPVTRDELLPVMANLSRRMEELLLTSKPGLAGNNVIGLSSSALHRMPQAG